MKSIKYSLANLFIWWKF